MGAVEADLRLAIEAGEVRGDLDAARAMRFLYGAWNGVIAMALREDRLRVDQDELKKILEVGRSIVVDGLRAGIVIS
ncbi:hypothetical protein [Streptomyces sp. NBC_01800]|uniref:hypothetical protein n=1 Tax=Streptomyces sp. NBC_01800 TaxID=2975945 RepID=UPI002DD9F2E6|nr:hypothetical protein [Streptomyces sp. NBC_01800]WSA68755.1 hypothetical protein OIE65_18200 [Streptomyces sp. NBC_01800]